MATKSRDLLKSFFKRRSYPTESNFSDLIDSLWHKEDIIPATAVEDLPDRLNNKFDKDSGKAIEADLADLTQEVERIASLNSKDKVDQTQIVSLEGIPTPGENIPSVAAVKAAIEASADELAQADQEISDRLNNFESTSAIRALFVARGAVYNSATGYYELNGLTDITEAEMSEIYNATSQIVNVAQMQELWFGSKFRTNFPALSVRRGSYAAPKVCTALCQNNKMLEVFSCGEGWTVSNTSHMFNGCAKLKQVIGTLLVQNVANMSYIFPGCALLKSVDIYGLKVNLSFADSPLIDLASLQFLVTNAANTKAITVTVHPVTYTKLTDTSNAEWYAVNTAAEAKNIAFASSALIPVSVSPTSHTFNGYDGTSESPTPPKSASFTVTGGGAWTVKVAYFKLGSTEGEDTEGLSAAKSGDTVVVSCDMNTLDKYKFGRVTITSEDGVSTAGIDIVQLNKDNIQI